MGAVRLIETIEFANVLRLVGDIKGLGCGSLHAIGQFKTLDARGEFGFERRTCQAVAVERGHEVELRALRNVGEFRAVHTMGSENVDVRFGATTSVVIAADDNILPLLSSRVIELGGESGVDADARVYLGSYDEYVARTGHEAPGVHR